LDEVEKKIKETTSRKAPCLDGFTSYYFQSHWKILGKDIWEVVEESLSSKSILQAFNAIFIALISKE
jgi:hypothetical protein